MIDSIKEFFNQFIQPGTGQTGAAGEKTLQIATAALLLEMMRMDNHIAAEERDSVVATLRRSSSSTTPNSTRFWRSPNRKPGRPPATTSSPR